MIKRAAYWARSLLPPPKDAATILSYHSISEVALAGTVPPLAFEAQMKMLSDEKFNVVSLEQLVRYRALGMIPKKTIAITFDDGYRDTATAAIPILKAFGFPAALFVITSQVGNPDWDRGGFSFPILSWEELHALDEEGVIAVYPHTVTHPKMHIISPETAEREMRESREEIEKKLGGTHAHLAYPSGRHTAAVRAAAARAGIRFAYTVRPGVVTPKTDNHAIPRNTIDGETTLTQFRAIALRGRFSRSRTRRWHKSPAV